MLKVLGQGYIINKNKWGLDMQLCFKKENYVIGLDGSFFMFVDFFKFEIQCWVVCCKVEVVVVVCGGLFLLEEVCL